MSRMAAPNGRAASWRDSILNYSEVELAALADAAYLGEPLFCPRDRARVAAEPFRAANQFTDGFEFLCSRCRGKGSYQGNAVIPDGFTWSLAEKHAIERGYRHADFARCPTDRSILRISESNPSGSGPIDLAVRCPRCGRFFRTNTPERSGV